MTVAALGITGLRWRPHDGPVDDWSVVHPVPLDNRGFVEARPYLFERAHGDWLLLVDDEPLQSVPGAPKYCTWTPGFYAGEVTAELLRPDGTSAATFLLDVAPDPVKSGREMFGRMLDDLWHEDPALVLGTEPATSLMGELGESEDPWVALARLRRYAPAFVQALRPIQSQPRRGLRTLRGSAPLHHVKRADRITAASALRSPAAALFFGGTEDLPATPTVSPLDVPVIEETVDTAGNRAMRSILSSVLHRGQCIRRSLEKRVLTERESATRTSLAARWPVRRHFLNQVESTLTRILRRQPFSNIQRAPVTAAGLTAVSADPLYARAWGLGWRAIRHGVEGSPSVERTWISPSWEIYERWCFVQLGRLLSIAVPEWNWKQPAGPQRRWTGTLAARRAELRLQPVFGARSEPVEGPWSVSRQRVPDIVLTVDGPDGTRFVVLDAKYRATEANVLDAMASAHIYQDSLRIRSRRPEASLLLVPSAGGVPHLEEGAFHAEHRVGVHPFSPDAGTVLPQEVTKLLAGAVQNT